MRRGAALVVAVAMGAALLVAGRTSPPVKGQQAYIYEPVAEELFSPIPLPLPLSVLPTAAVTPSPTPSPRQTPTPTPTPTPKPPPRPVPKKVVVSLRKVTATWYCNYTHPEVVHSACMKVHPDTTRLEWYAAAGPSLRNALGASWRGRKVKVTSASGLSVWVILADWCLCTGSGAAIDLYYDAFKAIGPRPNPVTISW